MKKVSKRPHRAAFLRKWWQLLVLVLAFSSAKAQSDAARYMSVNGYGFKYKRHATDSVQLIPLFESPHTPYRAGAIKYRTSDSSIYAYTGTQWLKVNGSSVSTEGVDSLHIYTASDPAPDTLYQYVSGDSTLVGYIQKTTASNGLTKTANNIALGGFLNQSTLIDGADSWTLSLLGLTQFRVEAVSGGPGDGTINLSAGDTIAMSATSYKMNALNRSAAPQLKPMLYDTIDHVLYYGDVAGSPGSKVDSIHIYTASDPDPDSLYQYINGDSTLVGYIPKGGGGSGDTTITITPFPLYVTTPVDENDPDTLRVLRDSAYAVTRIIQDTTGANYSLRSTAGSLAEFPDGKLAVAYSFYKGATIGDLDSAVIAVKLSHDRGGSWVGPYFLLPPSGKKSIFVPSLLLQGDTLFMMAPVVNSDGTSDFWLFKSVDTGKTWNAGTQMSWTPGAHTHRSHALLRKVWKNPSGPDSVRVYYPWAINTPGSGVGTATGHYEGRLSYSDDNMVTWTELPVEFIADDSIVTEPNIHYSKRTDSLYYTWRGRSGHMLYSASGDRGMNWVQQTAVNSSTANFGIKKGNNMHSIEAVHDDHLYLAFVNPVVDGFIDNSANARKRAWIYASTSGSPRTFYPAQVIKGDTTGGRSYGDINICITTDYVYCLYYVASRGSTAYQYEMTRIPLNKFAYLGVADSLPGLYVKRSLQYHDTVIARFAPDRVLPAGVSDLGSIDIVSMPRNGSQALDKTVLGLVGRGIGSNTQTGLIIQGITPTNSAVTPSSNWDAALNFDGRYAGGELTNFDLVRFTNNANAPYLRMIPTASTDGANVWFKETALFGSATVGATTYELQVRDDVTHTTMGIENRVNDASQNRIDFLKTRGGSIASTNDFIGGFTFNVSGNYFKAIGSALTNSVTGARLVNYQFGTTNQANSNIIGMQLTSEGQFSLPVIATRSIDTTLYKDVVVDAAGNFYKTFWQASSGSYTFQHSITESGGTVNLVGDEASPGANEVYGTDASGNKVWKPDPAGGSVTDFVFTDGSGFDGTVSTSTSTPTLALTTSLTTGSVPFIGASGALSQDNANLFWNNTDKRLGIGTATPGYKLDLRGTTGVNLHMVNDTDDDGVYHAMGAGLYYIGMNSAYSGSTHTAKATTSAVSAMSGSTHFWYANSGLTAGNTYSLTERMRLNTTGLGIGTASPAALLHPETADGGTNAITFPFRISHVTSSTATTGFGVGLQAAAENGSGTTVVGGTLAWPFTDATAASEDVDFTVNLMAGGSAAAEKFRVLSDGRVRINSAYYLPSASGTNGQVLTLDGSNNASWQTPSGGTTLYTGDGSLSGSRIVSGGGTASLSLGASGSKLLNFGINSADDVNLNADDRVSINGGMSVKIGLATDADFTVTTNMMSVVLIDVSANRTLTLPSVQPGMLLIIHNQNSSGSFVWNVTGVLHNPANGSVTTLANDTVYMLQGVDDGVTPHWKIISLHN